MTVAKRRLTEIKFEHEGAHVSLVGKHQGGPANGITTLIAKAASQAALKELQEIAKAQEVELAAFKESATAQRDAVRKVRLQQYMSGEQATAMVKALSDTSDIDFTAVIAGYVANNAQPVEKSVDIEIVKPKTSAEITFDLLQAKYGKK